MRLVLSRPMNGIRDVFLHFFFQATELTVFYIPSLSSQFKTVSTDVHEELS